MALDGNLRGQSRNLCGLHAGVTQLAECLLPKQIRSTGRTDPHKTLSSTWRRAARVESVGERSLTSSRSAPTSGGLVSVAAILDRAARLRP